MLACFGLNLATFTLLVGTPAPVEAAQGDLQLISQTFNVPADGSVTATLALPARLAGTDVTTAEVVVTVYQRIEDRAETGRVIDAAADGDYPRPDDVVTISPGCCVGSQPGQFTVTVPLEVAEVSPAALSIPRPGLYPLTVALQRDGKVLASMLSFFNRLPGADESNDTRAMNVAVAISTRSTIHVDSSGRVSLDSTAAAEATTLAEALEALTANQFPATVRVTPRVLSVLREREPDLFTRLITSLQAHQVVVEPQWPLDASVAAAAQQDQLYTAWWRAGKDSLRELGLGPSLISTSSVLVDSAIGSAGASLRRNLGAELIVMSPEVYDDLDGSIQAFTDFTGGLVSADLPNGTSIDIAVVDHIISEMLAHPLASPELTRIYVVANLLGLRQDIVTSGASAGRHSVVIAAPDLGVPDPRLLGAITALIVETPGLTPTTVDEVGFQTDRLLVDGEESSVTLPAANATDLRERIFRRAVLGNEIDAVASMLPDDDQRPQEWRDLSDLLPTSALDDSSADGVTTSIRSDLAEIRDAVQIPTSYTINLPGRRSTVRLRFLNNADVPLKIKVQLSSPSGKLVFANSDIPYVLDPGVPREVEIGVEARANGTSGVSLDVSTPNDVPLGATVALKFRVRALGLGNVLTGAVFALVLVWWLNHVRTNWRRRRRAEPATLPAS